MDANVLLELFKNYNSHKEEIYDKAVDIFISKVRNSLEDEYNAGHWAKFVNCTQLGIVLKYISTFFDTFEYDFGYVLAGETLQEDYDCVPFDEYFFGPEDEFYGYQYPDIVPHFKPFADALKRKGFQVYVDKGNYRFVVAINIG